MRENVKVTLAEGDSVFFGPGAEELFIHIKNTGSVREAAANMNMSYSKAWKLIRLAESTLDRKLVERSKGGEGGGGSASLTEYGEQFLETYLAYSNEVQEAAREIFRRHYND